MSDFELDPNLVAELDAFEQSALEQLAKPWMISIQIRPTVIGATIADFVWAVKITTAATTKTYIVGGEPDGPFKAIQRAIDKHAYQMEI